MTPAGLLAADGPFAELVEDYAPRPQQIDMAEAIANALRDGESLVCEAGTGTGKTFAYLVPAVLSGLKVIVSTGTRHLQDQIHERDLPLVRRAIGLPVDVALLKGRANYLCLLRLHQAEAQGDALDRGSRTTLVELRQWANQRGSGDLAGFPGLPEESRLRPLVTSTTENCLGQACDHYEDCFVFRARKRAQEADITVVNHYLFLSDLGLRERGYGELLPDCDAVIFDEAHQLPDLASQFFSRTVSSHQWLELLVDARAAYAKEAADLPEFPQRLSALETALRDLRLALGDRDGSVAWREQWASDTVRAVFSAFLDRAHETRELLEGFADRGKLLDNCNRRFTELMTLTSAFHDPVPGDEILWSEIRGRGFLLHRTPLQVADAFRGWMDANLRACVFTSATLSAGGDFSYFTGRLGIGDVPARGWDSPFDFARQAMLYVPGGLPDPRAPKYTELAVAAALPVLELTRGRGFFLFTSYRALNLAVPLVRAALKFPVLVQGEAPRTELLERFRATPHAVLLGTGSFWEGVDVRGQALSCVIIDKLPFAAPDDPVLQARMQRMEEEGHNPFMEFQVPEAIISLRQGIGRLIRDRSDYGVLMLCDPRLLSRPYGRMFLRSLPPMGLSQSLEEVTRFFDGHEHDQGGTHA